MTFIIEDNTRRPEGGCKVFFKGVDIQVIPQFGSSREDALFKMVEHLLYQRQKIETCLDQVIEKIENDPNA